MISNTDVCFGTERGEREEERRGGDDMWQPIIRMETNLEWLQPRSSPTLRLPRDHLVCQPGQGIIEAYKLQQEQTGRKERLQLCWCGEGWFYCLLRSSLTTWQVCSWRKLGDNNQTRQIVHRTLSRGSVRSRGLKLLSSFMPATMPPIIMPENGGRMWWKNVQF